MKHLIFLFTAFFLILFDNRVMAEPAVGQNIVLTQTQAEKLAEKIKENTPDNTHFKSAKFRWVALDLEHSNAPENLKEEVVRLFSKHYELYLSEKDIPADKIATENGEWVGYNGGFSFSFSLTYTGKGKIEITFGDREGNEAGSGFTIEYSWDGSEWRGKETGDRYII